MIGHDHAEDHVQVGVGQPVNVEVPAAHVVVDHEGAVGVLEGSVGRQDGAVGLDDVGGWWPPRWAGKSDKCL